MTFQRHQLALRGLVHFWRTNLAVVLGVATAVAVLAGALLVGDSVRGSLRALVSGRLGQADYVVASSGFVRAALADDVAADPAFAASFTSVVPMLVAQGFVSAQTGGARVGHVAVYGVDDRFWRFHGVSDVDGPSPREAFVSTALAADLRVGEGDAILVRLPRPSAVPLESLHSRKNDLGRTVRVTVRRVLPAGLGEFSLRPQQGDVRAVFVSLSRLQADLEMPGRANTLLAALAHRGATAARTEALGVLRQIVGRRASLDDVGLRVRQVAGGTEVAVESAAGLLDAGQESAVTSALGEARDRTRPLLTYLANTIRVNGRDVPYSLITGTSLAVAEAPGSAVPPIVLTDWLAKDLSASVGDRASVEYFLWQDGGRLQTVTREFRVAAVVPLSDADRDMAPEYPGITDSPTLDDWDPPFPVDLRRVRPQDEAFWKEHRTTPKAFVPLAVGQDMWRSRYGATTSVRVAPGAGESVPQLERDVATRVRARVDPLASLAVRDVRGEALEASRGATNFGEYFVYFSFFLVVSALLLVALFFKLSIEQRVREVGLLRAVGFGPSDVRGIFLREGVALAVVGSVVGAAGALGYAWLVMAGLRTLWVDAVGTSALAVHVTPTSLAAGAFGGFVAAVACIWWTLRSLSGVTERSLLAGALAQEAGPLDAAARPGRTRVAAAWLVCGVGLLAAGAVGWVDPAGAFFGAGSALLVSALLAVARVIRRPGHRLIAGTGWRAVGRLGLRSVSYRPARAVLSMAVVAAAAFVLVTVGAFRRGATPPSAAHQSGVGGYSVMVESLVPLVHDPDTEEGRRALGLTLPDGVRLEPFRVLPGDDASCLNLYAPTRPRVLGARARFLSEGRFTFQSSVADTDAERANPWVLLQQPQQDGAIPVIADANSLTYVLHTAVGQDFVFTENGRPIRLRVVGALKDSVLQGELVMAESDFLRLFPAQEGYGLVLADTDPSSTSDARAAEPGRGAAANPADVTAALESALSDFGADAKLTIERLDEFHRVENTYLSTFQTLGGLGLLLGTVGVAAVLLRNVLERRRELALLSAVGYRPGQFLLMSFAENLALVGTGLLVGGLCAWVAVLPAITARGIVVPVGTGGLWLLGGILVTALVSALVATRAATGAPLLSSLRSE